MSLAEAIDRDRRQARDWGGLLEEREMRRSGVKRSEARAIIARRLGATPGTLENVRKRRLKSPAKWLMDRLRGAVIRELEAEAIALEHEIHLLRQSGVDPRDNEIGAVVASLAAVRQALGLSPASGPALNPHIDGEP